MRKDLGAVIFAGGLLVGGLGVHHLVQYRADTLTELDNVLVQRSLKRSLTQIREEAAPNAAPIKAPDAAAPTAELGDEPSPEVARRQALEDAAELGLIGLLNSGAGGDLDAPTATWGTDDTSGSEDPLRALGSLTGDDIGEAFGAGSLGLQGIGGGGTGEGFGGLGYGTGGLGSRSRRAPRVSTGISTVSGRLPAEVIQRIVRSNFGRLRACYESGLRADPSLSGRVTVQFTIGTGGAVSAVTTSGSLTDATVKKCVARAFTSLVFPQPEGGIVSVSFPIVFSSADHSPPPKRQRTARPRANKKKNRIRISKLAVTGLAKGMVRRHLNDKRSKFRKCLADARVSNPSLSGNIELEVGVDALGKVIIGKRSDAILSAVDDGVAQCVLDVLETLVLDPPTSDSAKFSFKLVLKK